MEESSPTRTFLLSAAVLSGFSMMPSAASALSITTTVAPTVLTTGGGVVAAVLILKKKQDDEKKQEDLEEGEKTAQLMDVGLILSNSELPAQLQLLLDSPSAMAQLNQEVQSTPGAATQALAHASGLSVEQTQATWAAALAESGDVTRREDAQRVLTAYVEKISDTLQVSEQVKADALWRLAREAETGGTQEQSWVADWLGLPVQAVQSAVATAFPAGADAELREAIAADPQAYSMALAVALEAENEAAIDARLVELQSAALN